MALTVARRSGMTRYRIPALATDTWTGTNGAAWAAQWSGTLATGATRTIQSNQGQLVCPSTATYAGAGNTVLSGMTATVNTDLLIDWIPSTVSESYFGLGIRADQISTGSWMPINGYSASLATTGTGSANTNITIFRWVGGTSTNLNASGYTFTAGTTYHMRFMAIGAVISYRIWTGSTEPSTWTYSGTDSSPYNTAGKITLGFSNGAVATSYSTAVDNMTVTSS